VPTVTRPGEAVIDVVEFVIERGLSTEWPNRDVMAFVSFEVGPDRNPLVITPTERKSCPWASRFSSRITCSPSRTDVGSMTGGVVSPG
jgi:hypothetical protein